MKILRRPLYLFCFVFLSSSNFLMTPINALGYEEVAELENENAKAAPYSCHDEYEIVNKFLYERKPQNQGKFAICYAYSATQSFDAAYYQATAEKIESSPLMLSLYSNTLGHSSGSFLEASTMRKLFYLAPLVGLEAYLIENASRFFKPKRSVSEDIAGGFFKRAAKDSITAGHCSTKFVSDFFSFVPQARWDAKQSAEEKGLDGMLSFLNYYEKLVKKEPHLSSNERLEGALSQLKDRALFANDLGLARIKELQAFVDEYSFYKAPLLKKAYHRRTLAQFFMKSCSADQPRYEKLKLKFKSLGNYSIHRSKGLLARIDKHFSSEKDLPISLDYCVGRLMGEKECGLHSSIIYGKRCSKGRFYVLVRNSWGGPSLADQRRRAKHSKFFDFPKQDLTKATLSGDFWLSAGAFAKHRSHVSSQLSLAISQ